MQVSGRCAMGLMMGIVLFARATQAGSLTTTNAPAPTMHTLEDVYRVLTSASADTKIGLNTTNAPASSMHDLAAIYQAAVTLTNVGTGPKVFQSGVTLSYATGDDGYYQTGATWPNPVFTVGSGSSSNCITDNRTGLMWLKNPTSTTQNWFQAITYCEGLDGSAGRGGYTDWRMPNINEVMSLFDYGVQDPISDPKTGLLPEGHPFISTALGHQKIWTSTSVPWASSTLCWIVNVYESLTSFGGGKYQDGTHVWPVRGGN